MKVKKEKIDVESIKKKLLEKHSEKMDKIFDNSTNDFTFDQLEKLVDKELDEDRCEILEERISHDPAGISTKDPDDTSLCLCGRCAILRRDEEGNPKIEERQMKTKRGNVKIKEYAYYCSHCRKVFFPSERKAKVIRRKLQS